MHPSLRPLSSLLLLAVLLAAALPAASGVQARSLQQSTNFCGWFDFGLVEGGMNDNRLVFQEQFTGEGLQMPETQAIVNLSPGNYYIEGAMAVMLDAPYTARLTNGTVLTVGYAITSYVSIRPLQGPCVRNQPAEPPAEPPPPTLPPTFTPWPTEPPLPTFTFAPPPTVAAPTIAPPTAAPTAVAATKPDWFVSSMEFSSTDGRIIERVPLRLKVMLQNRGARATTYPWEGFVGEIRLKDGSGAVTQTIPFTSGNAGIVPLKKENGGRLEPVDLDRYQLTVYRVIFTDAVPNGMVEVALKPSGSSGRQITGNLPLSLGQNDMELVACSLKLGGKIVNVLPLSSKAKAVYSGTKMGAAVKNCADVGCAVRVIAEDTTKYLISNGITWRDVKAGSLLVQIYDLFNAEKDLQVCRNPFLWMWELLRELSRQGLQVNLFALHSPVLMLATDAQGRQAGFMSEHETTRTMEGSIAYLDGESKYLAYPAQPASLELRGTGQGAMTLEVNRTDGETTREEIFNDVPVTPQMQGSLAVDQQQAVSMRIDLQGQGQMQEILPDFQTQVRVLQTAPQPAFPWGWMLAGAGVLGLLFYFLFDVLARPQGRDAAGREEPKKTKGWPGHWGVWLLAGAIVLAGLVWAVLVPGVLFTPAKTDIPAAFPILAATEAPPAATEAPPAAPAATEAPPAAQPSFDIGSTQVSPSDGMLQVFFPAGSFQMGSNNGEDNEKPVHTVTLDGFWIDRTEVTNEQYEICVAAGACEPSKYLDNSNFNGFYGSRQPAIGVSWFDAARYCAWAGRRLPTEAEWEFAARGPEGRTYPWGSQPPDRENTNCCGWTSRRTTNAGSYSPAGDNPFGVQDMAGNVWEWVADWYGAYGSETQINPSGPSAGDARVLRGGSWGDYANGVRSSFRIATIPDDANGLFGFRCASAQDPAAAAKAAAGLDTGSAQVSPTNPPAVINFWGGDGLYQVDISGNNLRKIVDDRDCSRITWNQKYQYAYGCYAGPIHIRDLQDQEIQTASFVFNKDAIVWDQSGTKLITSIWGLRLFDLGNNAIQNIDLVSGYGIYPHYIDRSPVNSQIAISAEAIIDGINQPYHALYIMNALAGQPVKYKNSISDTSSISFSVDGEWVAYSTDRSSGANLSLIASDGSGRTSLVTGTAGRDPSWSRDGKWLAFATDTGLSIIMPDGSNEQEIVRMQGVRYPVWRPERP